MCENISGFVSSVFLVTISGCCGGSTEQNQSQFVPAPFPQPVQKQAPQPPADVNFEFHFVTFSEGNLNECSDFTITTAPFAEVTPEKVTETHKVMVDIASEREGIEIQRPCSEQFSDRTVLASCTEMSTGDEVVQINMKATYYNFGTVKTDNYMRDCLRIGGDWVALDRSSDEWRRARMRYNAARASKNLERAQKAIRGR